MSCYPCFSRKAHEDLGGSDLQFSGETKAAAKSNDNAKTKNSGSIKRDVDNGNIPPQAFTFRELASATKNFKPECLIGEGGFGRVYKGCFKSSGQVVAVKQLDRNGLQGNKQFTEEVKRLGLLNHPNLVNLIGYCADGEQRLLVYEFMPLGSLENYLLDLPIDNKPLDWYTRMKIALGVAQGLEYLHEKASPPVIYRDLKSSSILLDECYNAKISDCGLARLGSWGDKLNVISCAMGAYGNCAPEYSRNGEVSIRSDVYSFGVVLLELITGRRVIDTSRPINDQNLVAWAHPIFKDQKRFSELADPLLKGTYPAIGLNQAVGVAAMCLQEEASVRPIMTDIVTTLSFLIETPPLPQTSATLLPADTPPVPEEKPQYHPPGQARPQVSETTDPILSNSNSNHFISSKSLRSKPGSSKSFKGLREVSRNSRYSSCGNGGSSSSSMHSVDSEGSSSHGSDDSSHTQVSPIRSLSGR